MEGQMPLYFSSSLRRGDGPPSQETSHICAFMRDRTWAPTIVGHAEISDICTENSIVLELNSLSRRNSRSVLRL